MEKKDQELILYKKKPSHKRWLFYLMILGQIISVSLNELVAHLYDVVYREGGRGERIEHSRLIDGVLFKSYCRFDGEKLNVYIGHIHSRTLCGKTSDVCGLNAELVYKAGDLNTRLAGQVVNKTVVEYVAAYLVRHVGYDSIHYSGSIFVRALVCNASGKIFFLFGLPTVYLPYATARIFVKRNVVLIDKLGVSCFYKKIVIFCVVLTGLGAVVSKAADIFVSYEILAFAVRYFLKLCNGAAAYLGIEILSVRILKLEKPSHMIDSGYLFLERLFGFHFKGFE